MKTSHRCSIHKSQAQGLESTLFPSQILQFSRIPLHRKQGAKPQVLVTCKVAVTINFN